MMEIKQQANDYSIRIAELVKFLREDAKDFPLSGLLLQSGVEAGMAACRPDKESRKQALEALQRADYLICMAVTAGYLTELQSARIREEGRALLRLLSLREDTG